MLAEMGVTRYAINLTNLNRAVKSKKWLVADHLPSGAEWVAYCDEQTTWEMAEPFVDQGPLLTLAPLEWSERFLDESAYAPFFEEGLDPALYNVVGLTDVHVKHQTVLRRILADFTTNTLVAVT